MRILLVTDQRKDDEYFKQYSNYALKADIDEIDYRDIKSRLEVILLQKQEHVDLIIFDIEQILDFETEDNILTYIRSREDHIVYSQKNFKLNYIPVIFIHKSYMIQRNGDTSLNGLHCEVQRLEGKIDLQWSGLSQSLDKWLRNLSNDINLLDLDTNFNFQLTNNRYNEERINDCKILSRFFLANQKKLEYNWIGNKLNLLENGVERMYSEIRKYEKNPRFRNEKEFHKIFNDNQAFLRGEHYEKSIYEKQLYYKSSRRYIEVDFINIGHKYFNLPLQLYEVKLPSHSFISKKGILYNYTRKYFDQIGKKYKDYFDDIQNSKHIKEKLHTETLNFSLSLLMGRKDDIEENKYLINKALSKYDQAINLESFDDLLERYNFVYKRIKRFSIH